MPLKRQLHTVQPGLETQLVDGDYRPPRQQLADVMLGEDQLSNHGPLQMTSRWSRNSELSSIIRNQSLPLSDPVSVAPVASSIRSKITQFRYFPDGNGTPPALSTILSHIELEYQNQVSSLFLRDDRSDRAVANFAIPLSCISSTSSSTCSRVDERAETRSL